MSQHQTLPQAKEHLQPWRKRHTAVVTTFPGAKLSVIQVTTLKPESNEVRIANYWTCSGPLDLHRNDGHLLVNPPQVLGDGVAGRVVEVGPEVQRLKVGDYVFGFAWRSDKERGYQEYIVTTENLLGVIPEGFSMPQVVTVPGSLVTILHTCATDFGMEIPWPKVEGYQLEDADEAVLIWGGSSSTGMLGIQVLTWLGYTNIVAVASGKHHGMLKAYGAKACFDHRNGVDQTVRQINEYQAAQRIPIKYILDYIGSLEGSLRPISKLAKQGAIVAVLLPIILKDAAEGVRPEYSMDVRGSAGWAEGVLTRGVRTHTYLNNRFLADKAQPEMMPALLAQGVIKPTDHLVIKGISVLERAEKGMTILRNKAVSGQRMVWRVLDEAENLSNNFSPS